MVLLILVGVLLLAGLMKWFFGLEDLGAVARIFRALREGRQHPLSSLFQVSSSPGPGPPFQVDEKSNRHGGELVAAVLKVSAAGGGADRGRRRTAWSRSSRWSAGTSRPSWWRPSSWASAWWTRGTRCRPCSRPTPWPG